MGSCRFFSVVLAWVTLAAGVLLPAQQAYDWKLPRGFPDPPIPADNLITSARVELGRHLFYDTRLSGNGTQACASCHEQKRAFTDGRARSIGSTGQAHPRSSMSLVNVAYAAALTWGNSTVTRLEDQALVLMYGKHPVELGLDRADRWLEPFTRDATYQRMFREAFSNQPRPITQNNLVKATATFERTIVSARSPYDRYHFDRDDGAISEAAKRGEILFHSRPLSCFMCHGGVHFAGSMGNSMRSMPVEFHNTGLYNLPGLLSYPAENAGLYDVTRNPQGVGTFKAPTLRNIAVTAPYMHDGSVATLEEAIDHYAAGGRTRTEGPYQGVGRDNPDKSATIRGFAITLAQRADLVAFLQSLTDNALLDDSRFTNPWSNSPTKRAR